MPIMQWAEKRVIIMRKKRLVSLLVFGLILTFSKAAEEPPVPDDCKAKPFEDGLALDCSLSAINSAAEKTNFSVLPVQHTLSLTVRCRDPVLSQLEAHGLKSLKNLKSLTLDGCHLRSIPARAFFGPSLVSLTIITRNAGVLAVESGAFNGLETSLEHLDLSSNFIRHLAPGVLCGLAKLSVLNLSKNEIGSLSDLGLGDPRGCQLASLSSLDMSSNGISALTQQQMQIWPRLKSLKLARNYLRTIEKSALNPFLESLDVSNNQLTALHRDVFKNCNRLDTLILANNTLSELPDTIFQDLTPSLTHLDMSGNFFTSLTSRLVSSLDSLVSLDLSQNEVESIHSQALNGMKNLQYLRLDGNRLPKLSRNLFRSTPNLHTIVLSDNALAKLSAQTFVNLNALSTLLMDRNLLQELPPNLFVNNSHTLTVLDLSHNRFHAIPEAVSTSKMQRLQSLSLSGNAITALGTGLQMPSLWRLEISDNKLANITHENLAGLPGLQVLDLSLNSIRSIEKGAFSAAAKALKALRLDSNNLLKMDNLFQDLASLSWLNVSANSISVFDYAMLPRASLTWLDLHQNALESLGNYFSLEDNFPSLSHIDASFNRLNELGPQNVPNNVETLVLNDNQIQTLVPYTFFKKTKLKKVDLSVNQIESIDRNALRLPVVAPAEASADTEFLFGGNPIKCDCHMAWFKSINQLSNDLGTEATGLSFPKVADLESIYCQLLYSRDQTFVPLVEAATDDFLCTYKVNE